VGANERLWWCREDVGANRRSWWQTGGRGGKRELVVVFERLCGGKREVVGENGRL